jgi:hypothetical protein
VRIDIDELRTVANWGLADTAPALEIYADKSFKTSDGLSVLAGSVERQDFRHRVVGTVVDGVATFPKIAGIYTTEDSLTNQQATYSAYIRVAGREPIPYLVRFPLAPLLGPQLSVSWTTVEIHALEPIARRSSDVYTRQQTENAIAAAIQQALASRLRSGVATLVNGEVEVTSDVVKADSRIAVNSMDENVTGVLRAPQAGIIENESFLIQSTNADDNGFVSWLILY